MPGVESAKNLLHLTEEQFRQLMIAALEESPRAREIVRQAFLPAFPVGGSTCTGQNASDITAGNFGCGAYAFVASGAGVIPLAVKGAASQTADLQQWQDSSGAVKAILTATGSVVIGGTATKQSNGGPELISAQNSTANHVALATWCTADAKTYARFLVDIQGNHEWAASGDVDQSILMGINQIGVLGLQSDPQNGGGANIAAWKHTTLTADVGSLDTDTQFNVVSTSQFAVNDYLRVDNEIVQVTAKDSTTIMHANRHQQGSTIASHLSGHYVTLSGQSEDYARVSIQTVTAGDGPAAILLGSGATGADTSISRLAAGGLGITGGNVGIGTTDPGFGGSVTSKLTIVQTDSVTALTVGNTSGMPRFALNPQSNGSWRLYDYAAGHWNTAGGITQNTGNVGIGTTSPASLLHVYSTAASEVRIEGGNVGDVGLRIIGDRAWKVGSNIGGVGTGKLTVWDVTAGASRVVVDTSGNVGIGMTAPSLQLQVAKAMAAAKKVVTFSATPTFDASLGNTQVITLTGNVTSSTLSSAVAGQWLVFDIIQDSTGSRTFVWPSNVKGGGPLDGTANMHNVQMFYFDGTNAYAAGPMKSSS